MGHLLYLSFLKRDSRETGAFEGSADEGISNRSPKLNVFEIEVLT